MTEYQQYSNFPRDFENDLNALSAPIYDDDLIPILDREDDSDLSHYESSRCSSLSGSPSEWICRLFAGNVAYQIPRAPPPTPLVASPSILPMLYNEGNGDMPAFELSASLKELGACAIETQLYQFPPLNSYGNPPCSPPTPPPSACSNRTSLDDDHEEMTLYSFLRQPYSMVEIDYQLQLLSIKQQAEQSSDFMSSPEKRGSRLRKASLSSIEKAGTLKRKISDVFKRSISR